MNECASPSLILIGGFAGTGKTTITRRLSAELHLPRLGSDTIGRTIKASKGMPSDDGDAYWIAYDLLFRLCSEFLHAGVSTILDLTMGWEFHWRHIEQVLQDCSSTRFLPVMLQCSHETSLQRIRRRYEANPDYYDPPEHYETEPKLVNMRAFLANLERPDAYVVDADRSFDTVYHEIKEYVSTSLYGKKCL